RVEEISFACGYHNVEHFIRQFKKEVGMSPMQYRKK
ncbi:MAG: helix-turn-helix transcriptional regulator, partial [Ruminococcaceae bacterium]|nr:helix-turn-helix transcriptional regulator [Oscillospiraceae bacterium]